MNCANHVEVPAVAYCRTCGKPMCSVCSRDVRGVILLRGVFGLASKRHHAATASPRNSRSWCNASSGGQSRCRRPPGIHSRSRRLLQRSVWQGVHPRPDFRDADLGCRPRERHLRHRHRGVRAVHADRGLPDREGEADGSATARSVRIQQRELFRKRDAAGSSTAGAVPAAPVEGQPSSRRRSPSQWRTVAPVGALILIGLGVLFLLNQFDWFRFDWIGRFWPLILIAIGVSVLMKRTGREW